MEDAEPEVVGSSATLDERFADAAAGGGLIDLTASSSPAVPPAHPAGTVEASDVLTIGDTLYSNSFDDGRLYYRGTVTTVLSNCAVVRFEDGNGSVLRMRRRLLCWALPAGEELYEEGEGGEGEGSEGEDEDEDGEDDGDEAEDEDEAFRASGKRRGKNKMVVASDSSDAEGGEYDEQRQRWTSGANGAGASGAGGWKDGDRSDCSDDDDDGSEDGSDSDFVEILEPPSRRTGAEGAAGGNEGVEGGGGSSSGNGGGRKRQREVGGGVEGGGGGGGAAGGGGSKDPGTGKKKKKKKKKTTSKVKPTMEAVMNDADIPVAPGGGPVDPNAEKEGDEGGMGSGGQGGSSSSSSSSSGGSSGGGGNSGNGNTNKPNSNGNGNGMAGPRLAAMKHRIGKILERGLHEGTPEAEAQQAMRQAQRLLKKHNLSQARVILRCMQRCILLVRHEVRLRVRLRNVY
jgi:hypothetical protein